MIAICHYFTIFAPNMRFFTFILSLYLLALTGLPCTDMLEGEESSASYEFVTTPTGEHSHFHLDICSPFCICTCCQMVICTPTTYEALTIAQATATIPSYSYPLTVWSSNYYGNIWTPPKI